MKMKKITAMVLAVSFAFSMETTAFASEVSSPTLNEPTKEIKATYNKETSAKTVYYVDVEWGNLEYTFNSGITKIWNPDSLKFEETTETSKWECAEGADKIKVTNHSNADVTVGLSYEKKENTVNGTLTEDSFVLLAAKEGSNYDTADSKTVTLQISGSLDETKTGKILIGNVNVTVKGQEEIGELSTSHNNITGGTIYSTAQEGIYTVTVRNNDSRAPHFGYFSFVLKGITYCLSNNVLVNSGPAEAIAVPSGRGLTFTIDTNTMTYSYVTVN